jgi:hypothetical protein
MIGFIEVEPKNDHLLSRLYFHPFPLLLCPRIYHLLHPVKKMTYPLKNKSRYYVRIGGNNLQKEAGHKFSEAPRGKPRGILLRIC